MKRYLIIVLMSIPIIAMEKDFEQAQQLYEKSLSEYMQAREKAIESLSSQDVAHDDSCMKKLSDNLKKGAALRDCAITYLACCEQRTKEKADLERKLVWLTTAQSKKIGSARQRAHNIHQISKDCACQSMLLSNQHRDGSYAFFVRKLCRFGLTAQEISRLTNDVSDQQTESKLFMHVVRLSVNEKLKK